jgi:2-polyprenyl-6-methoxyphenol hydroxylase-like FAD-dependent oxidoreductase
LNIKDKVITRYGIGSYAIHRGRLQQALLNELDQSKIHLNKKLSSLQQSVNGVNLVFEDKTFAGAELVVGADGIKSVVRKSFMGEIPYRYTGQTCWRGMTRFKLPSKLKNNSYEMWGNKKGLRFGFVPTAADEVYYFTTFYTEANQKDGPGVKDKIQNIYKVFGEIPARLIESTPEENIIRSDITDFQPISKWWDGRVVLIGDAAHATTPNLGQGGCQAVEDAFVIAKTLKEKPTWEEAFAEYQRIRFEKAAHVVNMSWRFGMMTNIGNPVLRFIRNGIMRSMPESTMIKQLDKIFKLNY